MTRVIVVEDEPEIRGVVAEALTDEGYRVTRAAEGESALRLLREQLHDLAIVDLMMPGMDGQRFLRECRADPSCASLQIVVVTAAHESQLDHLDVQAVVLKPFDLGDLVDTVIRLAPP